jgi:hypothetical protein
MFENCIAMIVLYRSSRLIFQVKFLTINLSIADFLVGLMLMLPEIHLNFWGCNVKKYFIFTVLCVSLLSITMINGDRVLIFRFAMRYYEHITKRTLAVLCVITWPIAVLLSYLMFFDKSHAIGLNCDYVYRIPKETSVMITTRSLQLLIMLSNILMLAYMVYYIRHKFRRVENSGNVSQSMGSRDAKLIRKLWYLAGGFIVMTFPFLISMNLSLIVGEQRSLTRVVFVCFIICMMNSALNPVVYVWRFREPRFQLQLLVCCCSTYFKDKIRQRRNRSLAEYDLQAHPQSNGAQESKLEFTNVGRCD